MGLDLVELLIATEEEFQIVIPDEEAEKCETPGMLAALVHSRLRKSKNDVCPSMHGFYLVRRALMDYFSLQRETIKPDSKLDDLIIRENRRKRWNDFLYMLSEGKTIHVQLIRPYWAKAVVTSLILTGTIITYFVTNSSILAAVLGLSIGVILFLATSMLKTELPNNYRFAKDLIPLVRTLDTSVWTNDEVYTRVKILVVEQLGVNESDVHPDSHFIKDLGAG